MHLKWIVMYFLQKFANKRHVLYAYWSEEKKFSLYSLKYSNLFIYLNLQIDLFMNRAIPAWRVWHLETKIKIYLLIISFKNTFYEYMYCNPLLLLGRLII